MEQDTLVMARPTKPAKAENDPRIFTQVRNFLKALNSGGGKPIEELSPANARAVLVTAQKSVHVAKRLASGACPGCRK